MKTVFIAALITLFSAQASAGYKWGVWPHKRLDGSEQVKEDPTRNYGYRWGVGPFKK